MYTISSRATDFRLDMDMLIRMAILAIAISVVVSKDEPDKDKEIGTVIGIDLGTTYSW